MRLSFIVLVIFGLVLSLVGCSGLPVRPSSNFYQANIKKIEVRFLRYYYDEGYYLAYDQLWRKRNRAMRDGYDLYDKKLKDLIKSSLEKKGYSVKFGEPMVLNVKIGTFWEFPYISDASPLYFKLEPALKRIEDRGEADAILIFAIRGLIYRWVFEGKYTSPDLAYRSGDEFEQKTVETNDINTLWIHYHLFGLAAKRRLLANQFRDERRSKVISEKTTNWGTYKTVLTEWGYTETEREFIERSISSLFSNFPTYKQE